MKIKALFNAFGFIGLGLFITCVIFVVKINQSNIAFTFFGHVVYTTSGFILLSFSLLFYSTTKLSVKMMKLKHKIVLSSVNNKYLRRIALLKHRKESIAVYEALKRPARFGFLRAFESNLKAVNLKYYEYYVKDLAKSKKIRIAKSLFKRNPNNSVAALLYIQSLIESKQHSIAREILHDFVEERSILIENTKIMYLMSKQFVQCEKEISGSFDFAQKYLDYIDIYERNV